MAIEEHPSVPCNAVPVPEVQKTLTGEDDDDVDSEMGDSLISFDYAALEEAQRIAASKDNIGDDAALAEEVGQKRKQRGGCKETHKRRKKERREDDILRAKQAGLKAPSLKEILAAAAAASSSAESSQKVASDSTSQPQPLDISIASSSEATESLPTQASVVPSETPVANEPSASATASGSTEPDAKAEASAKRFAKEAARRAKIAASVNARTVFITNLPFKVSETEISEWLVECGKIKRVRLSMDKGTSKPLGYAHVQFESAASVETAIAKYDRYDVQGRVVRVARVGKEAKCEFELPQELKDDIVALMKEKYEGMNISTIKDAWQKRHPGQKLDTHKFGFKNFSTAMKTISGISLEHHVEKVKTYLAFFTGSDAHTALLEDRKRRAAEKAEAAAKAKEAAANTETTAGTDAPASASSGEGTACRPDNSVKAEGVVSETVEVPSGGADPSTTPADGIQEATSV